MQVDFDKILEREDAFKDIDYGFSCLGSSAVKRGSVSSLDHYCILLLIFYVSRSSRLVL